MEIKQKITSKAHNLFFRYGVKSISMDTIAAAAGVSKKTIYQFFADKNALVDVVMNIEMDKHVNESLQIQKLCENAIHELFLGIERTNKLLTLMNPSLMYEMEKYHPKIFKKLSAYKNKFVFQLIKSNMETGIVEGLYRNDFDIDIIAQYRMASIFSIFDAQIFPHGKHSLVKILEQITEVFLYGITTPKGQKFIQKYKSQKTKP